MLELFLSVYMTIQSTFLLLFEKTESVIWRFDMLTFQYPAFKIEASQRKKDCGSHAIPKVPLARHCYGFRSNSPFLTPSMKASHSPRVYSNVVFAGSRVWRTATTSGRIATITHWCVILLVLLEVWNSLSSNFV